MKFPHFLRPAFVVCAALGLALAAAPLPAHAFTFTNADGTSGNDGSAGFSSYKDLNTGAASRFGSDNADKYTPLQGNGSLRFGAQPESFDQRYNPNRMFSPDVLMGR